MTASAAASRETAVSPTGRGYARLVLVLGALIALGPLTIDMYLPAFPRIGDDLQASDSAVQLTLTGMLLGLAVGQLVIGPLSDAWGRRRPLIVGICTHAVDLPALRCRPDHRRCSRRSGWCKGSPGPRSPWSRWRSCGTCSKVSRWPGSCPG